MDCPRCRTPLTQTKVDDVTVERCAACGGLWVEFAELDRLLTRESRALRALLPKNAPPTPALPPVSGNGAGDGAQLTCPRCAAPLIRMHASPEPVVYYACLGCYGRWLDGSEIQRIVGRPLTAKFGKLFQKLLD